MPGTIPRSRSPSKPSWAGPSPNPRLLLPRRAVLGEFSLKHHATSLAEVRSVYAELAQRPVQRNCLRQTECCQFQLTEKIPQLTRGEALLAAEAFRATGRKTLPLHPDGACPMLQADPGKCLIYAARTLGCRTHFCQTAGGPIERHEVLPLIRRLEKIDRELEGDGPHPLPPSIAQALDEF